MSGREAAKWGGEAWQEERNSVLPLAYFNTNSEGGKGLGSGQKEGQTSVLKGGNHVLSFCKESGDRGRYPKLKTGGKLSAATVCVKCSSGRGGVGRCRGE